MFKIRDKILVTFLSVVIIPIIITGTFFGIYMTKILRRDKIAEFHQSSKGKSEKVIYFMRSIENDIISLGNNVFLLNLIEAIRSNDTEQINRYKFEVGNLFRMFSESRGIYDQIRYIDKSGQEIVRVNAGQEYAYIVPPEELRDKSHRYYFKKALKLKEGDVYVSSLDLNREQRGTGPDHKTVLRYAIPVFDSIKDGKKQNRGIIALNVQAYFLLKNILTSEYKKGVNSYLLDKEGFYLLHPDITKQWGGQSGLNTGKNLKNDFPQEISSLFLSGQSGNKLVDKQFVNFIPIHFNPLDNERYWILLESLPKSIIYSSIYTFYVILGVLAVFLITGVVIAAFVFSRKLTRPLNALVKGVTTIAEHDLDELDYHITATSNDEIAFLTFSFNKMVYNLGKARRKLLDYALNLEKKVDHKTEEVLEKADELKKINEELEDFVYIISHDLKEPLFAIEGHTSRLLKTHKDALDDKGKFYINRTKVNIEKMSLKINEIMEVLKVGRVTYDLKSNDSGAIVREVVSALESKIGENKINVSIQDNLPIVLCDEKRMRDILSNLITNAIKFMGEDKKRQIRIGCDENGGYHKFFVEDTGIGIREEYKEQIFKIFNRLNEVKAEGTGVGLAIVKKIVEQHKGKIWIESPVKDGRGSRFCFAIPMSRRRDDVKPDDFENNDIGAIAREVVSALESMIAENKINVSIRDDLPIVLCDGKRMRDVLSNLITNAIKFMGEDKKRQVRIGCDKSGGYHKFFVEDTGIGIREEHREQIFEIFKRLNEIKADGAGVGLAMVKKIVEQHKGIIWVESPVSDGKGSRFCFAIPMSRRRDDVKPEPSHASGYKQKTLESRENWEIVDKER